MDKNVYIWDLRCPARFEQDNQEGRKADRYLNDPGLSGGVSERTISRPQRIRDLELEPMSLGLQFLTKLTAALKSRQIAKGINMLTEEQAWIRLNPRIAHSTELLLCIVQ